MTSRTISSITPYVDLNSDKLVLNAISIQLGDGAYALDTTGESTAFRPQTTRSFRENLRRILITNSDNETVSVKTTCGLMVNAIETLDANTATAADIINAVRNAVSGSSGPAAPVNPPSLASSISLKDILANVVVIDPDNHMAINDTGETTLEGVRPEHSLLFMVRQLTAGQDGNLRINTTSGRKVAAIANQDPNTATAGTLVLAVQQAF